MSIVTSGSPHVHAFLPPAAVLVSARPFDRPFRPPGRHPESKPVRSYVDPRFGHGIRLGYVLPRPADTVFDRDTRLAIAARDAASVLNVDPATGKLRPASATAYKVAMDQIAARHFYRLLGLAKAKAKELGLCGSLGDDIAMNAWKRFDQQVRAGRYYAGHTLTRALNAQVRLAGYEIRRTERRRAATSLDETRGEGVRTATRRARSLEERRLANIEKCRRWRAAQRAA